MLFAVCNNQRFFLFVLDIRILLYCGAEIFSHLSLCGFIKKYWLIILVETSIGLKMRAIFPSVRRIRAALRHHQVNYSSNCAKKSKNSIDANLASAYRVTFNADVSRFFTPTSVISRALSTAADYAKVTIGGCLLSVSGASFSLLDYRNLHFFNLQKVNFVFAFVFVFLFSYRREQSRASRGVWAKNNSGWTCGWGYVPGIDSSFIFAWFICLFLITWLEFAGMVTAYGYLKSICEHLLFLLWRVFDKHILRLTER